MVRLALALVTCLVLVLQINSSTAQSSNVKIRVATFGGIFGATEKIYIGDRLQRLAGIQVEWIYGNPTDNLAKLIASRGRDVPFDVIYFDDPTQQRAVHAGLLEKLDPKEVPNLSHLYKQAIHPQGYGPHVLYYSIGIIYNKDKFKAAGIPEPKSWNDLWDPRLADHVALPDISTPMGAGFAIKIAQLNGGDDGNVIPGLAKIAQIKPHSLYTSSSILQTQLSSGDVWAAVWQSGRAWPMIDGGSPLGYVIPKEGSVVGTDTIDMVKGTKHPREAQMFINMALDPLTQLSHAYELAYGPVIKSLDAVWKNYPDVAKRFPANQADLDNLIVPNWAAYNEKLKETVSFWERNFKK